MFGQCCCYFWFWQGKGRIEALSLRAFAYERSKDWDAASLGISRLCPDLDCLHELKAPISFHSAIKSRSITSKSLSVFVEIAGMMRGSFSMPPRQKSNMRRDTVLYWAGISCKFHKWLLQAVHSNLRCCPCCCCCCGCRCCCCCWLLLVVVACCW